MKERPILMKGAMVRATLEDRKTQTRRIIKPQLEGLEHFKRFVFEKHPFSPSSFVGTPAEGRVSGTERMGWVGEDAWGNAIAAEEADWISCPYGVPGDRLWVKETFTLAEWYGDHYEPAGNPERRQTLKVLYRSTEDETLDDIMEMTWKPSIFMPRWASRITLDIESVRVERLQEISEDDAVAEGITAPRCEHCGYTRADARFQMDHRFCQSPEPASAVPLYRSLWESINGAGSWDANPWVWVIQFRRITP